MKAFEKHIIKTGTKLQKALITMNELASDAVLFVVDDKMKLQGSLTDGDVRRGLLKGLKADGIVNEFMNSNPKFILKGERNINKVIEYREKEYRIVPVIDKNKRIINVISFGKLKSYLPIDAVIMAGGRGERLRPLTDETPKPLLKVGTKPILEHNIDRLALYGVDDFWITLRYLGNQIEEYFGTGNNKSIEIQYVFEDTPMGTIGSVSKIKNFIHDYVLVVNSDVLTNIDYEHFFLDFLNKDADFSVVTIPYHVTIPYAVLETENGSIVDLKEKPTYTYYSNGGIYLMKKSLLGMLPVEDHYNITDLMELLISKGHKVVSYPLSFYWLDIGSHANYEKAKKDIENLKF